MCIIVFYQTLDFLPHVVLYRKQYDIGALNPAIWHWPLRLDHTTDAVKMLHKVITFCIRRVHDMDPQPTQVTKNLDSHFHSPIREDYGWTAGISSKDQSSRRWTTQ